MDETSSGTPSPIGADVHANSGDIDSLLTNEPHDMPDPTTAKTDVTSAPTPQAISVGPPASQNALRRVIEPYERHRAHDLRAECYRRGIRPIKKGPNANDNKNGYIALLRKYDGTTANGMDLTATTPTTPHDDMEKRADDDDDSDDPRRLNAMYNFQTSKKRRLPMPNTTMYGQSNANAAAAAAMSAELHGFYEHTHPTLVPVLPMQYPTNMLKSGNAGSTNPTATAATTATAPPSTSDLEILSGIANTYTQNTLQDGPLCYNCRSVMTDQGVKPSKMQPSRWLDQCERDTLYLKEVLAVLAQLRKTRQETLALDSTNTALLDELDDDIAFFQTLKKRTKDRMKHALANEARSQTPAAQTAQAPTS